MHLSPRARRRLGAFVGFVAISVPFGIVVHLFSELVEFGGADAGLAFSDRHRYLVWLAAGAFVSLLAVARFAGFSSARRLAQALPFGGRGAAFFLLSSACQYGVFAVTQRVEGSPLDQGAIAVGILAAVFASLAGGVVLAFACARMVEAAFELAWYVTRASDRAAQSGPSWFSRRPPAYRARAGFFPSSIANRPPPLILS